AGSWLRMKGPVHGEVTRLPDRHRAVETRYDKLSVRYQTILEITRHQRMAPPTARRGLGRVTESV
ncbi:hypothetical protein E1264_41360, partial [Actinomadura sp. KC216]|uniref:hypothetical protein n=1 Tax=Actinomadura sp. KC216 TaxID=2530370 RepID=UPI0010ED13B2